MGGSFGGFGNSFGGGFGNAYTGDESSGSGFMSRPRNENYGMQGNYNTLAQDMSYNRIGTPSFQNGRFGYQPAGRPQNYWGHQPYQYRAASPWSGGTYDPGTDVSGPSNPNNPVVDPIFDQPPVVPDVPQNTPPWPDDQPPPNNGPGWQGWQPPPPSAPPPPAPPVGTPGNPPVVAYGGQQTGGYRPPQPFMQQYKPAPQRYASRYQPRQQNYGGFMPFGMGFGFNPYMR